MRALVGYASRHGATREIAEEIGRVLREQGLSADVAELGDDVDAAGYDAFVLVSCVYVGQWLDSARRFVEKHGGDLVAKDVWLFSSGPLGEPPRPLEDQAVQVDALLDATTAREHRLFPGKLDKSRLGFGEHAVVVAVRAAEGDFRPWDEIRAWAVVIAAAVRPVPDAA